MSRYTTVLLSGCTVVNSYALELQTVVNKPIFNGTTLWLYCRSAWLIPTHQNSRSKMVQRFSFTVRYVWYVTRRRQHTHISTPNLSTALEHNVYINAKFRLILSDKCLVTSLLYWLTSQVTGIIIVMSTVPAMWDVAFLLNARNAKTVLHVHVFPF